MIGVLRRRPLAIGIALVLGVVLVVAVVVGLAGRSGAPGPAGPSGPSDSPGAARSGGGSCTAPEGASESDVDTDDSDEYPWARTPGQKVTVYFETGSLPPRYADFVEEGARMWSRSACVQAVAIERCPSGANCSTVETAPGRGDDGETDGESEGTERGDIRVANVIRLYTELLDDSSDNGALVTVVHEMGHALGLRHRLTDDVMMSASTSDDTDPEPDDVDLANLVAIYGTENG